ELADRLGWPMRQLKVVASTELRRGVLRFALAPEILELALRELVQGQVVRASARLGAWCDASQPGPMSAAEAEMFADEWQAGRLRADHRRSVREVDPAAARARRGRSEEPRGSTPPVACSGAIDAPHARAQEFARDARGARRALARCVRASARAAPVRSADVGG